MEGELLLRDDREPVGFEWSKIRSVTRSDLGIRFVFGTGIALIAAVAGMVVGPKFGGLFLAFPAILPASLTLIGTAAFLKYGVPALATRALRVIPPGVDAVIGTDTLRFLDRSTFKPSNLTPVRQAQLRELFAEVTAGASPDSKHFRLELRRVGSIGANALALPSGIVVLTDELEHLAKNDDELRGVFAHEVGHLVNRHAMRMLLQSSATALLLVGILGDVSGVSSLVTAAPTVLVNAAYSRDFEREADGFAFRWMSQHGVAPERLGDLLKRLAVAQSGDQDGYLASHPDLGERIRAARSHRETAR